MKNPISNYFILLCLAILFIAPGIAAFIFYQHPTWLGSAKVNKGTLLNPPVVWNKIGTKQEKWQLVFWYPGICNAACSKQITRLAKIRLALGRKLYQVDQYLVLNNKSLPISAALKTFLKEHDFQVIQLSSESNQVKTLSMISAKPQIFIANPDNYLILSYETKVKPEDIYKDLKLLLSTTDHKSG